MLRNEELFLDKLSELVKIANKSNELKEFELQAKSEEIFALKKRNNIDEEYHERMLKVLNRENDLKEHELTLKKRELELRERELKVKEKGKSTRLEDLSEEEKLEIAYKLKNFFD